MRGSWFVAFSLVVLAGAAVYRLAPSGTSEAATGGDLIRAHMRFGARDLGMPGPAPQAVNGRLGVDNESCEACHEREARQWRGSQHSTAYTDHEFQRALAREPMPFCRTCHAPEADPMRPASGWQAEIGVGCVTCHVVGDAVLAGAGPEAAAPHPLRRDPRFGAADACANCHEFGFPDNHRRAEPLAMQRTIAEHAASPQRDTTCVACHMRDEDGARSHVFRGTRDVRFVADALEIRATRVAADAVEITIGARADRVGHAVLTGDLFRRLTIAVRPIGPGPRRAWASRYLSRHYKIEIGRGTPQRTELWDDRPHPGAPPQVLRFALDPADAARSVAWEVRLERVDSMIAEREDQALVVGSASLVTGELPPP